VPRTLLLRKAVALLAKSRGAPAKASKAGNAEPQRSAGGEYPIIAVFVLDLECIGSEPNRVRRKTLEDIHPLHQNLSAVSTGVRHARGFGQQPRPLKAFKHADFFRVSRAELFEPVLKVVDLSLAGREIA
jgi:hypothetical protein